MEETKEIKDNEIAKKHNWQNIRVSKDTKKKLAEIGRKEQTYEEIIIDGINELRKRKEGYFK